MYGITPSLKSSTMISNLKWESKLKNGSYSRNWKFNSLMNYTDDDFTPTGNLCYINDIGEKLHQTPMQELYNLRWYIQHLIDENEYQSDDDEWTNPLSESNWIFQTNKKFMKYVIFTLQEMTPEQLKQNPTTVHPNQRLDTDEEECNNTKDEEEFTTSQELLEENSTSDIPTVTTEESKPTETSQVLTVFNKTINHEDDSSEDKSVTEIEPNKENREQKIGKDDKLSTTNFEIIIENENIEGLISNF